MSLTTTHPLILVLCAVIGSGAVTSLVSWLLRRIGQRRNLEQAIAESATIRRLELEIYRQSLFLPTTSRMRHEHQLDAGKAYTERGGNGLATCAASSSKTITGTGSTPTTGTTDHTTHRITEEQQNRPISQQIISPMRRHRIGAFLIKRTKACPRPDTDYSP